jgi:AGCS family alanine or glycine:cation symporter
MQLDAVLDFSDAMVFAMAFVNVLALFVFAPGVKRDLDAYWARRAVGA